MSEKILSFQVLLQSKNSGCFGSYYNSSYFNSVMVKLSKDRLFVSVCTYWQILAIKCPCGGWKAGIFSLYDASFDGDIHV